MRMVLLMIGMFINFWSYIFLNYELLQTIKVECGVSQVCIRNEFFYLSIGQTGMTY